MYFILFLISTWENVDMVFKTISEAMLSAATSRFKSHKSCFDGQT